MRIVVTGPQNTPYCGGFFEILMHFKDIYPNSHPEIYFKTPIYHLNMNSRAIPNIITNIYALFYMVNPDNPYGIDKRYEYINNWNLYEEKVKYFSRKYANSNNNINREYNGVLDFSYEHWVYYLINYIFNKIKPIKKRKIYILKYKFIIFIG